MAEAFHWVIFAFHFAAACLLAFGVWLRCDQDVWVSRMYVDTYAAQANSTGLWWYDAEPSAHGLSLRAECSLAGAADNRACFDADLPLYERVKPGAGWHLFALLGQFEWISSSFAFFYIKHGWHRFSWVASSALVCVGTLLFMPFRGEVFYNEVLLMWANAAICVGVFYGYRGLYAESRVAPQAEPDAVHETAPEPASTDRSLHAPLLGRATRLSGEGNLVAETLRAVQLPALRYAEYCITAAELWIAVLCVYVQDPPAFMAIGGYTLIFLTNLYGLLLHYSLVSDDVKVMLAARATLPRQISMKSRGVFRVPPAMLGLTYDEVYRQGTELVKRRVWGSYIASNSSTLLNSWLAYLVAMALIFYQETFLFSSDPPAFVVFAGWSLIVTYSSFGVWVTFVYWFPRYASRTCWFLADKDVFVVVVYGLDTLSLAAKLSIVGSLSYGFVFRAEGRC